jgi:hypothetical protein
MTAAPIPALAHDHDSPRGRGGMFPLTPPASAAAKTVFRRSVAWASSLDPPSQIASNMPDHADHASRLPRSTERPALKSHSPSPLAVAISAARGFLPRRLSAPAIQPSPPLLCRAGVRNP